MEQTLEGTVEKVDVGEAIDTSGVRKAFGGPVVVKASCRGKGGQWFCTTHDYVCENQFDKDTHIGQPGNHRMAWICLEHGLEQP